MVKNKFQSKGFIYDICYVLIEFKMDKYYNIKKMIMDEKELNDLINDLIIKEYFKDDIQYINNKKYSLLKDLFDLNNLKSYSTEIPKKLSKECRNNNKLNKIMINLVTERER